VTFSAGGTSAEERKAGLVEQLQQVADGVLRLNVAETFPLSGAAKAQELSEAGHTAGKFVVVP
jgi:NADPH:quinone reductase-like Zn-dependent oxidoreductase